MKVFRLYPNPNRDLKRSPHDGDLVDPFSGYDVQKGAVVRAETEEDARTLAESNSRGDEQFWMKDRLHGEELDEHVWYDGIWTNENLVKCEELTGDGEEDVLMTDFYHG